jgi:hypothetical protein
MSSRDRAASHRPGALTSSLTVAGALRVESAPSARNRRVPSLAPGELRSFHEFLDTKCGETAARRFCAFSCALPRVDASMAPRGTERRPVPSSPATLTRNRSDQIDGGDHFRWYPAILSLPAFARTLPGISARPRSLVNASLRLVHRARIQGEARHAIYAGDVDRGDLSASCARDRLFGNVSPPIEWAAASPPRRPRATRSPAVAAWAQIFNVGPK